MASQPKLAPKEEVVYSLAVCFEKSMILYTATWVPWSIADSRCIATSIWNWSPPKRTN